MDQSNSNGQTFIPIMIIVLLVLQSILLIFVLKDIRFIKQLTLLKSVSSQAEEVESLIGTQAVSYTHLRAHETPEHLVCRLLLEKKKNNKN